MNKRSKTVEPKPYDNIINKIKIFFTNHCTSSYNLEEIGLFPKRYCKYGDMIIFNETIKPFLSTILFANLSDKEKEEFWKMVAQIFKAKNISIVYNILGSSDVRSPIVDILYGSNSVVSYLENGIKFKWDLQEVMFSRGNISEKLRLSKINCENETVLDMFAGIGYFTLSYLIHSKAKFLYACDLNPNSIKWLKCNMKENRISENRYQILNGDCSLVSPKNVAQRINLGLIPDCRKYWQTACEALSKETGGVLHIHENVNSKDDKYDLQDHSDISCNKIMKSKWLLFAFDARNVICKYLNQISSITWDVRCLHLEHVKSYAPHIDHMVLDLSCKPINLI